MSDDVDIEKLASVLNTTGQQGKDRFVKMLWNNQSEDVQSQLMSLLNAETQQIIERSSDDSQQSPDA